MPQPDDRSGGDLREVVLVLWRRKWIVLAAAVVVVLAAGVRLSLRTPLYRSTTQVLLLQQANPVTDQQQQANPLAATRTIDNQVQFIRSGVVQQAAAERLGEPVSVTVSPSTGTDVIQISAVNADPQRAADIANGYAQAYIDTLRDTTTKEYTASAQVIQSAADNVQAQIDAIDAQIPGASPEDAASLLDERSQLTETKTSYTRALEQLRVNSDLFQANGPRIITPAAPASVPFAPRPARDLGLALFIGLLLGAGLAYLIEYLDDSVKSSAELDRLSGLATLTVVPKVADWRDTHESLLVSAINPKSPVAEAYRSLRTSILFKSLESPIKTLLVTSPQVGDGKSTTVANLAAVMAQAGQRVVVVSCDLRRPRAHHFFGLPNDPGFTSVLLGQCSLLDAVQRVPQLPNIVLVPSGPVPPNPSELLASKKAKQLFEQLESAADLVIIDCPPVLPVTDAQVLSEVADAVLLVVAAGRTTGREVQHAVRGLEQVNAPLIGTVFNDSKSGAQYGYTYGDDHDGPTLPDASAVVPSAADTANDPVEAR